MRARLALFVIVVGCCGFASSCSSDSPSTTNTTPATTPPTSPPTTTPASGPVTMSTGMFGGAESAACATDLDQMGTAVESYLALNGGTEVTEADLVQQGLLHEESVLHDIGPGATVIPSPTGGCVS